MRLQPARFAIDRSNAILIRSGSKHRRFAGAALALALSALAMPALAEPAPGDAAAAAAADARARAAALVARMTLEEKAAQLKHEAPGIPRLGIPAYDWWSEGLHGVARAGEATVFPQAIGLAATFDAPLIHRAADVIATEFRAKYVAERGADGSSRQYRGLTVWSPNINIFRDPRWGRGQETFGEDPYLTGRLGVAFITGLQGDDPRYYKTVATAKHFAVHSGPEADRHRDDIHPSRHDLEDTYLPAFRAAVVEGKAAAVMCAYNAIDGVPACATPLLQSRVRGAWGFDGHIVSDCAAIADFFKPEAHRYNRTPEEAAAAALKAGTDLFCAEFSADKGTDPQVVVRAVESGLVEEAVLDRAITRLMEARIRLGLFDPPAQVPYFAIPATDFDTPEHAALAMDVARASMVLLKNDGLLPLKAAPRRIAVIGPNADSVDALVGNYNGTPSKPVTVLAGLRQRYPDAKIDYVEGTGLTGAPLKTVPDAALCIDAACSAKGVMVEEFAGPALTGKPVRSGREANISFTWGRPNRQERDSAIRWTGYIAPTETGAYRFKLNSFDGYRIAVDGREVVNAWDAADPSTIADGEIPLEAGKRYKIVVEARQRGGRGDQSLAWSNFGEREEAAIAAAKAADLVVYVAGLTAKLEGEEMRVSAPGFVGGDRTSLDLPAPQQKLLEALGGTGKPVVLVLMNGSALAVNWADKHIPAIVEAWYPGGPGGRAVADLIAGDYSPSGRLPVTFYRAAEDLPGFKDYSMAGRTYRYFAGKPLYRFGHGLSYTSFTYARPVLGTTRLKPGQPLDIAVDVTNSGDRDGAEVVQLYVHRPLPGAPLRALKGFQRVPLKRGETRTVRFTLDADAFAVIDDKGERTVPAGRAELWVGGGQPGGIEGQAPVAGIGARLEVVGG